jgi:hypothetical protein
MKTFTIPAVAALALAGCAPTIPGSLMADAAETPFVTLQPQPVPAELQGTWTGKMAYYLVTYRLNADGTALACMSMPTVVNPLSKAKWNGSVLVGQGGGKTYFKAISADQVEVDYRVFGAQPTIFVRDEQLKEAAIECQKAMAVG